MGLEKSHTNFDVLLSMHRVSMSAGVQKCRFFSDLDVVACILLRKCAYRDNQHII